MRDPRTNPQAGDVLRTVDIYTRQLVDITVARVSHDEYTWPQVFYWKGTDGKEQQWPLSKWLRVAPDWEVISVAN